MNKNGTAFLVYGTYVSCGAKTTVIHSQTCRSLHTISKLCNIKVTQHKNTLDRDQVDRETQVKNHWRYIVKTFV